MHGVYSPLQAKLKKVQAIILMVSEDQVKFVVALIASVPFSYLLRLIKDYRLRMIYSIVMGLLLQIFVYGWDVWLPVLLHTTVYLVVKIGGRRTGGFVTGMSILCLSFYHIYNLIYNYGKWMLDVSTIVMSSVCKYALFAYAYQDGGGDEGRLTQEQQKHKLTELPSFLQYFSYCVFLPTSVIGTAIEFDTYENFMQMKEPYKSIPLQQSITATLQEFRVSLICCVFYVAGSIIFPLNTMLSPQFTDCSLAYILLYSYACIELIKFKYYFGWKLSLCAVHMSGVSYKGPNDFTGVRTCDPYKVETTVHLRQKIANWNMSVELWLRRCVYQRMPLSKASGQLATFMISAFWHGFYGGYYFSFFLWFLQVHLSATIFKISQDSSHLLVKLYNKGGQAAWVICWILCNFAFNHNGVYFHIMSSQICFKIMKAVRFIPLIILISSIVLTQLMPPRKAPKGEQKAPKGEIEQTTYPPNSNIKAA